MRIKILPPRPPPLPSYPLPSSPKVLSNPNNPHSIEAPVNPKHGRTMEKFRQAAFKLASSDPARPLTPERKALIDRRLLDLSASFAAAPSHPPYAAMIHRALTELNEGAGASEGAISEFIRAEYDDLPWAHLPFLSHHLGRLCESGEVVDSGGGCYILAGSEPNPVCKFMEEVRPMPQRRRKRRGRKPVVVEEEEDDDDIFTVAAERKRKRRRRRKDWQVKKQVEAEESQGEHIEQTVGEGEHCREESEKAIEPNHNDEWQNAAMEEQLPEEREDGVTEKHVREPCKGQIQPAEGTSIEKDLRDEIVEGSKEVSQECHDVAVWNQICDEKKVGVIVSPGREPGGLIHVVGNQYLGEEAVCGEASSHDQYFDCRDEFPMPSMQGSEPRALEVQLPDSKFNAKEDQPKGCYEVFDKQNLQANEAIGVAKYMAMVQQQQANSPLREREFLVVSDLQEASHELDTTKSELMLTDCQVSDEKQKQEKPLKRRRGRPPKPKLGANKSGHELLTSNHNHDNMQQPQRRRGRPPKSKYRSDESGSKLFPLDNDHADKQEQKQQQKRPRGRGRGEGKQPERESATNGELLLSFLPEPVQIREQGRQRPLGRGRGRGRGKSLGRGRGKSPDRGRGKSLDRGRGKSVGGGQGRSSK